MLGDSLKRRHGRPRKPPPRPKAKRPPLRSPFSWGRWTLYALVVLAGSFGTGYILATQVFFPRPETAGSGVAVPSLYGQTRAAAESAIRELGLEVGDVRVLNNMGTEVGRVLAQSPLPGQQLRPGATVSLGVSGGAPELRVPPVVGLGEATARELLESVGFEVVVRQTRGADFPAGVVARADPPVGTPRLLPARVTLVVSTGPPPDSMTDPFGPGGLR
jgi:beta-lactam-binding protein with PASTA domain